MDPLLEALAGLGMPQARPCGCAPESNAGTTVTIASRLRGTAERVIDASVFQDYSVELGRFAVGPDSTERFLQDLKIARALVKKQPDTMLAMVRAAQDGDLAELTRLSAKLGWTEEELRRQGGDFAWVVFGVVLVVALVVQRPISREADPPRPPSASMQDVLNDVTDEDLEDADAILGAGD